MRDIDAEKKVALFIKAKRLTAGLTQEELAAALRAPQSMIAKLEGGEKRLMLVEAIRIARALGFPFAEFDEGA